MSSLPQFSSPEAQKCLERWYPLTDHPVQRRLVEEGRRFKVVPAGRRCLEAGTLVATPTGPVPIEQLQVGDAVIGFDGLVTGRARVTATWDNAEQEVWPLLCGDQKLLAATATHELWASSRLAPGPFGRVAIADLTADHWLCDSRSWLPVRFAKGAPYRARTYDITVGNESNLYCLANGIVTSNSGKTERGKRFMARACLAAPDMYFIGAPTYAQVKQIYWTDMKLLCFASLYGPRAVSEVDLTIKFPNGSMLCLIGFDKPQRFEGIPWGGGLIDEVADLRPNAWPENIAPALDTLDPTRPDRRAWAWLIGVPDGLNHYYDLSEYARTSGDADWGYYHWKSSDILRPDQIESAKRRMSARQFRQEYEASFEGASGRIYEDYGDENVSRDEIANHEQLHWMHDFNYSPLSSAIGVRRGNAMYLLDEIILESAVARQTALEFLDRYENHGNKNLLLYGDPAGKAGEKHGQISNYTAVEALLRERGWTVQRKVKAAAPAIRDRQNAVRAKICNAAGERSLFVNPSRAPYTHKGLATVQMKSGSTFLEEESDVQHVTTAVGYCVDYEWPVLIDAARPKPIVVPVPSVNHYSQGMRR